MDDNSMKRIEEFSTSLPLVQELCEMTAKELYEHFAFISALYGVALGYLEGVHPSDAYANVALACSLGLSQITEDDWYSISSRIANTLEERSLDG